MAQCPFKTSDSRCVAPGETIGPPCSFEGSDYEHECRQYPFMADRAASEQPSPPPTEPSPPSALAAVLATFGVRDLPPSVEQEIVRLVGQEQRIAAIKLLREHAPLDLKGAKDAVEAVGAALSGGSIPIASNAAPVPSARSVDDLPASAQNEIRALAEQGRKIEAIKLLREHSSLGLKEAKDAVEALVPPGLGASRGGGCALAAVAVVVAVAALLLTLPGFSQDASNLLLNPGFEEPGDGGAPKAWASSCTGGSRAFCDDAVAHTGRASGHLVKVADGESHVAALAFPRLDVRGGAEYVLSGWGKGHVAQGQATLFLYQYDQDGKWLGNFLHCPVPTDTDAWTPLHAIEKVQPNCAWVQVRFEIYAKESRGEAWVDDVYFGQDTTPPPPVRGMQAVAEKSTARLSWEPPPGEQPSGYQVYRSPYPRFTPGADALLGFTADTRFTDAMPRGFVYHYAVVALDAALNASTPVYAGPLRPPGAADLPEMVVWTDGPGRRWDPALPVALPATAGLALEATRGEYESAQVLVGATRVALKGVRVEMGEWRGPKGAVIPAAETQVLVQEYVELAGRARRVADPLVPARPMDIEPGMLRGWWLLVHVPPTAVPGDYRGVARVLADGRRPVELPLTLKVWPVDMPRGNHCGGSWGLWGAQMAQQEQVAVGSPEYQRLFRRYWEFLLDHRMIPRELLGDLQSPEAAKWLSDERISSFPLPTGQWGKLMTDEQLARFKTLCQYLRDRGWLQKGYVYCFDEPEEKDYPFVAQLARQVHEAGRDVTFLMTEQPEPGLYGAVDLWCPLLNIYATTADRCRERQQLGEQLWWYVCLAPAAPWPNYMLTNDPIDARVLSWLQVKCGVTGELYWATTCFPGDVWAQGLSAQWPGDGYLCYPGKPRGLDGPVTCLRAECIRDAKEDLELIWLLRSLAAKRGQQAAAEQTIQAALARVCTDFTHYTKSDADLAAARRLILEEIVRLQRG